jgi:monoamine oxidase
MAEKIGTSNVILNKRVTAIKQNDKGVTAHCADGSVFRAKKLITTTTGDNTK